MKSRGRAGAFFHGGGGGGDRHDGVGRGGRADDDVELGEPGFALLERQRGGAELRGQFHGALETAAGHGERRDSAALERPGGLFAHFSRADQ